MSSQFRMKPGTRKFLMIATAMAQYGFRLPHALVAAVTNRGWQMRTADGWQSIRINGEGRLV